MNIDELYSSEIRFLLSEVAYDLFLITVCKIDNFLYLFRYLTQYDCVNFYSLVNALK